MATISRRKLADYVADQLSSGTKADRILRQLAAYLVETRRTKEVDLVVRDIEAALLTRGTAVATVVSARLLQQAAKDAIEQYITSSYSGITQVQLRESVDETLIAGMRLVLPDKQLDSSIKHKLEKLQAIGGK